MRLKAEDRRTGLDLGNVALRTPAGDVVALSTVVEREIGRGPLEIARVDGQRVTYVTANLEEGRALGDAVDAIRERLSGVPLPAGFSMYTEGSSRSNRRRAPTS